LLGCGGVKGKHKKNNFLKCFLKEDNEGLLRISREISFYIEGAANLKL